ncbi:hypothetical protein RND71_030805 [Anisodus tanguticus]|uniref:Uncharacterized protein n=1 Tax=Anisodus tanguticus TaxID=243964 RepID=A0AAE1RID2_9SOLA|nr:hypothetical protein RND71_030805 [Anisodus tanguticus]
MLDINNLSQGWVLQLFEPLFVCQCLIASHHAKIIDYSKKMLYVRLLDSDIFESMVHLYGYNVDHKEWHTSEFDMQSLPYRSRNILKSSWSNHCVIVEDHLYRFQVFQYSNGTPQAILVLRDLENKIELSVSSIERDYVDDIHFDDDPPISGRDSYAFGYLVHLGKRNSCPSFPCKKLVA